MNKELTSLQVLLIIVFINAAGFFLRFLELDTYFILLGFRFHFSIFVSFLFILNYINLNSIDEIFIHPARQKFISLLFIAFLPLLIIPLDLFILDELKIIQQKYFFELGLSSIFDFPVYLLWNIPQLFLFYIFIETVIIRQRFIFIKASLLTLFLFIYELIPINGPIDFNKFDYFSIVSFLFLVTITGLYITRIKNIYLFSLVIFSVLWGTVLSFGSSSETLVKILMASQYEIWAGFVNIEKKWNFAEYIQPAYLFLLLLFSFFILKKKSNNYK